MVGVHLPCNAFWAFMPNIFPTLFASLLVRVSLSGEGFWTPITKQIRCLSLTLMAENTLTFPGFEYPVPSIFSFCHCCWYWGSDYMKKLSRLLATCKFPSLSWHLMVVIFLPSEAYRFSAPSRFPFLSLPLIKGVHLNGKVVGHSKPIWFHFPSLSLKTWVHLVRLWGSLPHTDSPFWLCPCYWGPLHSLYKLF